MGLFSLVDKIYTWTNSLIKDRFPKLSLYYYVKPRSYLYWRTQPIHKLYKGSLKGTTPKKSVLLFTVHKSASVFFNWFLKELASETGHTYVDVNGYFGTMGPKGIEIQSSSEFTQKVFKKTGFMYGPLRNYIPVPVMNDYAVILLLRDPRDVLTSYYFSMKNSHPMVTPELIKKRQLALQNTIDEYVLSLADRFVKTYTEYLDHVYGKPNVLFIKYEELITDFKSCLQKINSHCGLELNEQQLKTLDKSDSFKTKKEDPNAHIRKISSGDHKEKLKPETIEILNKKFDSILRTLNYQ